jgi:hypothetical protein
MKKAFLLGLVAVFAMLIYATEMGDIGINYLKTRAGADVSADTIAPAGTLFTAMYAVDNVRGMSSNTSMFIKLDSIRDSIWCVVKLQESWDGGTTWELTTTVCSIVSKAIKVDTGFDVDLFPAPFFRYFINNIAGTDSFRVEDAIFYNHAK